MSERHGASRRWHPEPAASAVPLTIRIFGLDNALGVHFDRHAWDSNGFDRRMSRSDDVTLAVGIRNHSFEGAVYRQTGCGTLP